MGKVSEFDPDRLNFIEVLREQIEEDEGYVEGVYLDSLGHLTAGYGHLLRKNEDPQDECWSDPEHLEDVFTSDIQEAVQGASLVFTPKYWIAMPDTAKIVFANMCYQLGQAGLARFTLMIAAASRGLWREAAKEALNSKVAQQQTPERWRRHAERLESLV